MNELAPAFAFMAEKFVEFVKRSDLVHQSADLIVAGFKNIADAAVAVVAGLVRLGANLVTFFENAKSLLSGNISEIAARNKELEQTLTAITAQEHRKRTAIFAETVEEQAAIAITHQDKVAAPIIQSTQRMAEAQRAANAELREQERLIKQGVALVEATRSPQEILAEKAKLLDIALKNNAISAEQFGAAMQRATAISLNAYVGMAAGIANNLATAFGNSKAFAIAAAIINTAESVTKTLATYGATPWGLALAASAAAAGAAQIATIKSTNKGGGGGGASASTTASATPAQPAQQQQSFFIDLQGERFGRDAVRGLIEQINDAIADGASINLRTA
jgi:hypothetical protein